MADYSPHHHTCTGESVFVTIKALQAYVRGVSDPYLGGLHIVQSRSGQQCVVEFDSFHRWEKLEAIWKKSMITPLLRQDASVQDNPSAEALLPTNSTIEDDLDAEGNKTKTYKCRAECPPDVFSSLCRFPAFECDISNLVVTTDKYGQCTVEFSSTSSLQLVKAVWSGSVSENHVMLETLAPEAEYTGERRRPL
jgi:hypothetical protein